MGEFPSRANQFPVNRRNHTKKGPYFLPMLKKFLNKKITYEDPETQKIIRGQVKDAIVWRLILNATQGDNRAIQEIFDRIDGKLTQKSIGEGFGETRIIIHRLNERKNTDKPDAISI